MKFSKKSLTYNLFINLLLIILLYSCGRIRNKKRKINDVYSFIHNKEESPFSLSNNIKNAIKYSNEEMNKDKLFYEKSNSKANYFKSNENFSETSLDSVNTLIFYLTKGKKNISKILQIFDDDTFKYEMVLASKYLFEDSIYITSSKFENDSIFSQTIRWGFVEDFDDISFEERAKVKVVYFYDNKLNFKLISKDTIYYPISSDLDSVMYSNNSFYINGINCYWKYNLDRNNDEFRLELKNADNESTVLTSSDEKMVGINDINLEDNFIKDFKDVNFDGYKDFIEYRPGISGNACAFYFSYVFDPKKKVFELSEEFSLCGLYVDSIGRRLQSGGRINKGEYFDSNIYFDDKGNIKYKEEIVTKVVDSFNSEISYITYTKIVGEKIVEVKNDTIIKD